MSTSPSNPALRSAGAFVILGAIGFVIVFSVLASIFGYPDVLDRPARDVLPALIAGGSGLKAWWIVYAILPLSLSAAALLAHSHLARHTTRASLFTAAGVAAGIAMAIGLLRWSTLQWSLGESWLAADATTRHAIEALSDGANRMLGNGLGEVVGETLLGTWLVGAGLAVRRDASPALVRGWLTRAVGNVTLVLAALMIVGAWRFAVPDLEAVTAVTNLLLPLGLITLGLAWLNAKVTTKRGQPSVPSQTIARVAVMASLVASIVTSHTSRADELDVTTDVPVLTEAKPAKRELLLNGFRAPSMGLELREDWVGFHVGLYPTILDKAPNGEGRTTWFLKSGVTFYFVELALGSDRPSGFYAGVALVQGLNHAWNAAESATTGAGGFFDVGFRWAAFKGFELRLGGGALVGFDGRAAFNFTPGFSWGIAL